MSLNSSQFKKIFIILAVVSVLAIIAIAFKINKELNNRKQPVIIKEEILAEPAGLATNEIKEALNKAGADSNTKPIAQEEIAEALNKKEEAVPESKPLTLEEIQKRLKKVK